MMDMAVRMRQNRALRLAKREKGQNVKNAYSPNADYPSTPLQLNSKLSKTELKRLLLKIRTDKREERKLIVIKTILTLIALAFISVLALAFFL